MDTRIVPTREGYDLWAKHYDNEGNPLLAADARAFAPLLEKDLRGLAICDLGCGTGRVTLRLAARGARVTGIDFSREMLDRARMKAALTKLPVGFLEHDLAKRVPFPDGTFDMVVSSLVLEHIENLTAFFAEAKRLCRPGGVLMITAMHPDMLLKGKQAAYKDPESGEKILPQGYPHGLKDFRDAIEAAGLEVTGVNELKGDEELARVAPRAEQYIGWPMVVALFLRVPLD